jgi:DNA polymerase III delta subunit
VSERPSLKPAYLISGSDRPKVETAVQRLRARFVLESVEMVSALEASGADVVSLCNSGSLFGDARLVVATDVDGQKKDPSRPATGGWKAVDIEAVATYLASPAPDTVLALVGLEVKKDAPIAKACAKSGDLLIYDVAKSGRVAWVADRFRQAGVKAEADACALLIEYVGEEDLHGLANEIDKVATWAQGEPVGVAEIEQLVTPLADVPSFALTDAWADRHPGHLLDLSETLFDRSDKPRRDTAPRLAATLNSHLTRMRQLKRLAAQGVPAAEAATTLKMHPFYGKKVYRQAEAFSDDELANATVRFAELDLALKGGSRLAPDVELLRALIDVSAEPGRD